MKKQVAEFYKNNPGCAKAVIWTLLSAFEHDDTISYHILECMVNDITTMKPKEKEDMIRYLKDLHRRIHDIRVWGFNGFTR